MTLGMENIFINTNYKFAYNPVAMPSLSSFTMPPMVFMQQFAMPDFGSIFNFNTNIGTTATTAATSTKTGAQGYNANALKELKNSPILKNVPQDRKTKILDIVDRASKQYNVDPRFVLAIIKNESNFNPNAKSRCGAMGLMQLMPATAKHFGASNAYDMEQNIFAGVKFLSTLLKRYNGNKTLAAAAYNAGPGRVKNAVPQIKETQNYVAKVNNTYQQLC